MLDPSISLAFSMQSNPGVYALLLGSGVSRSSRIPTGWEIVLELVRKVARLEGADCEPDPAAWYLERFEKEPDYGELLDAVAKTPDERQALLRSYFEPTDEERDDGAKMPTKAHRAIAKLVRGGYVRLIVTTNFDRLTERALEDEGIAPIVVSGPDQLGGLPPFAHLGCCVVKVHGDYLDTRIRNTPTELEAYAPEMNRFLDRVFDEFGLLVCGWSADWDAALRAGIERAPSRRYSMYWAARGASGTSANALLNLRAGHSIQIRGADEFFEDLQSKIESIEEFNTPHPMSAAVAVASVKRFLSDSAHRIRLADLLDNLGRSLAAELREGPFADVQSTVDRERVTQRVKTYDSMTSTMVSVAATCGQWGDANAIRQLRRVLDRIYAARSQNGGLSVWVGYQCYPATLIGYAVLLGASLCDNLLAVSEMFKSEVRGNVQGTPMAQMLPPFSFLENPEGWGRLLEGMDRRRAPVNNWIENTLFDSIGAEFVSKAEFEEHFDWVEILLALACRQSRASNQQGDWFAPGAFGYRSAGREMATTRINTSLDELGERSPYVLSGLFGATAEECRGAVVMLNKFIPQLRWW